MNVLFVFSLSGIEPGPNVLHMAEQMQFGISYISSFLQSHGHHTELVVTSSDSQPRSHRLIDEVIGRFRPTLVCFTAVSSQYPFIAQAARQIKDRYPDIYLLIGGVHVSLNPRTVLDDAFDALCIGEGEHPTLELVSQLQAGLSPGGIPNLWIKQPGHVEKNDPRPFLADLDDLPFPDRRMWQPWTQEQAWVRQAVLLGRGCPFQCTYCCNHAIRKLAPGHYVRFRSVANITAEIAELTEDSPQLREVYLEVETFGVDKQWALRLCAELAGLNSRRSEPLQFGVNLRVTPNADFDELFAACAQANFRFVNIGLESGSERIRREILNRHYSNDDVANTVEAARRYGLRVTLYNLIGVPTETTTDHHQTVMVNRRCQPDHHFTSIFFPYPGTRLHELCRERGLLNTDSNGRLERCQATLDLPGFSRKQIEHALVWFDYRVYRGHRPLYRILARVLYAKIRSRPRLYSLYGHLTHLSFVRRLTRKLK